MQGKTEKESRKSSSLSRSPSHITNTAGLIQRTHRRREIATLLAVLLLAVIWITDGDPQAYAVRSGGDWTNILTYMFHHATVWHLICNAYAILMIEYAYRPTPLEYAYGYIVPVLWAALVTACPVRCDWVAVLSGPAVPALASSYVRCGSAAALLLPSAPFIGASAYIYTMVGLRLIRRRTWQQSLITYSALAIMLIAPFLFSPMAAATSTHIACLLAGILLGTPLPIRTHRTHNEHPEPQ